MNKLKILILTFVFIGVLTTSTYAFLPENDFSGNFELSRTLISPSDLNNRITDKNNSYYDINESDGYDINKIDIFEEMMGYSVRLLYQAHEMEEDEELSYNLDGKVDEENFRAGWSYEYLSGNVSGNIDANNSEYNRVDDFDIGIHGLGICGEYTSRNTLGLMVSFNTALYYGGLEHTIKTNNNTTSERESLYGLGLDLNIGGVLELDRVNLYGLAGFRRMFLQYDLSGFKYTAGLTIRF